MIDPDILKIAESGIRLCLRDYPDAPEQAYEAFVQRFERSPDATRAMLSLLASLLHERISGRSLFDYQRASAADPSLNSPAIPSADHQPAFAGEPLSASDLPLDAQRRREAEPSSPATPLVSTPTASAGESPSVPISRDNAQTTIGAEPPAPVPSRQMPPNVGLARERPARQNVVRAALPPQAVNPPRTSLAAIAAANQRLAKSLLDTWMVGGRKFGDCRVQEVLDACDSRDRTTHLMRAVIRGMPPDRIIREGITAEGAQERYMGALAEMQGVTIDATQPGGYRHVQ